MPRTAWIPRSALAATLAVGVSGCTVTFNPDGPGHTSSATTPASIIKDGRITVDFRHPPTRQEFGLPGDKNWRFYEAGYRRTYDLTVVLPGGDLRLPAHSIDGDTDGAGGANDADYRHLPRFFTIKAQYPSDVAADKALANQSAMLGIDQRPTAATILLSGSPSNRLSVTVQRLSNLTASLSAGERYYTFAFDEYHNPAIDRVLHDGRLQVDLRHPPSRAELGFQPTYPTADISPQPPSTQPYTVDLQLPGGLAVLRADSINSISGSTSGQPAADALPSRTDLTSIRSVAAATDLMTNAASLGLSAPEVRALFTGSGRVQRVLRARTAVYDLEVRIGADLSDTPDPSATVRYVFTYRRS